MTDRSIGDASPFSVGTTAVFVSVMVIGLHVPPGVSTGIAAIAGALFIVGSIRGRIGPIDIAFAASIVATIAAIWGGGHPAFVLAGFTAAVLAWDVARFGLSFSNRIDRNDQGRLRIEAIHVTASLSVGAVAALVVFTLYSLPVAFETVTPITLLIVGIFGIIWYLR